MRWTRVKCSITLSWAAASADWPRRLISGKGPEVYLPRSGEPSDFRWGSEAQCIHRGRAAARRAAGLRPFWTASRRYPDRGILRSAQFTEPRGTTIGEKAT